MSLDSKAVFAKRLAQVGLGNHLQDFVNLGCATLGTFAFACGQNAGQLDETSFINDVVVPIFGDPAHPAKAALRRLHFEAYVVLAEEMKRRASRAEDDEKPRKLPAPERQERLELIKQNLNGLVIEGELEPSNALIDKLAAMQEEGTLRYLRWDELGRRDLEVRGEKAETVWKPNSSGALIERTIKHDVPADVSTDLKLKIALQRRGVAMEVARLCTFKVHDQWVSYLMTEYMREPLDGFQRVSLSQVRLADAELFAKLAEWTRAGLEVTPEGDLPLDPLIPVLMHDPRIMMMMMQTRSGVGQKRPFERAEPQRQARSQKSNGAKGGGKDKPGAKRKQQRTKARLPAELIGQEDKLVTTHKGRNICYAFNLNGCNRKVTNGGCDRGVHVCMRKGCGGDHSQKSCPNI